jgi:chromosome segregation ATPase
MKEEIACGRIFTVDEPGDQPATKDPYLLIYWEQGVHKLVDLLHKKDREIEAWQNANDRAMELYEKRNLDYWKLRKEYETLKNHEKRTQIYQISPPGVPTP